MSNLCTKAMDRTFRAKVTEAGRVSLPSEFRKAVGLERGGDAILELAGDDIRLRTVRGAVSRAQDLTRQLLGRKPDAGVDAFLAERRHKAESE